MTLLGVTCASCDYCSSVLNLSELRLKMNCYYSLEFLVKPEECRCCMQVDRCVERMEEFGRATHLYTLAFYATSSRSTVLRSQFSSLMYATFINQ